MNAHWMNWGILVVFGVAMYAISPRLRGKDPMEQFFGGKDAVRSDPGLPGNIGTYRMEFRHAADDPRVESEAAGGIISKTLRG